MMIYNFIRVIVYYALGFILGWAAYELIDVHPAHAPGPRELIIFFTLVGGVAWFLTTMVSYIRTRAAEKKVAVLAHLLVFAACALYVLIMVN
jgi:hypothetical protein